MSDIKTSKSGPGARAKADALRNNQKKSRRTTIFAEALTPSKTYCRYMKERSSCQPNPTVLTSELGDNEPLESLSLDDKKKSDPSIKPTTQLKENYPGGKLSAIKVKDPNNKEVVVGLRLGRRCMTEEDEKFKDDSKYNQWAFQKRVTKSVEEPKNIFEKVYQGDSVIVYESKDR